MKRTYSQRNTNMDEQNTCEFHPVEILFKEQHFDPKGIQHIKCFLRMKKWLILFLFLVSATGFAQENVIKLGIFGVGYGDFSLSYERVITPKSAINVTLGYINPNASLIEFNPTLSSNGGVGLKELYSGFHTSVDYKFYVGKKDAPHGFYVAPYLRYFGYKFLMIDEIDHDYFDVNSRISSIGLGFEMGYHWIVFDKISIDWYFLGVGAEFIMPKLIYTTDKTNFNYSSIGDNIREVFDGWDYFQKRLKMSPGSENMTAKLPTFFPGIKTGLTLGYAF